jgi:hypothetical protein
MINRRPWILVGVLLAIAIILPVGWYLISPLFINRSVDEALPTSRVALTTLTTPAEATMVPVQATAAMETAMVEPTHMMEEPMPAGDTAAMTILAQGEFYNVAHEGHGRATVYQLPDGSRLLRLEDFEVLNGPDLHVYLVPIDPVPNSFGLEIPGSRDLGQLKGNLGSQNYNLPADLDLSQFKSVVIWCQPFRVPFIAAPLSMP